jgi:hypothetical protein
MKKSDLKELDRISKSIPKELLEKLEKRVKTTPEMEAGFIRAVNDETLDIETREKAQLILDSGFWSKTHIEVDRDVENQISKYLDDEIAKSQKMGLLSKKARLPAMIKKAKKYGKRTHSEADSKREDGSSNPIPSPFKNNGESGSGD